MIMSPSLFDQYQPVAAHAHPSNTMQQIPEQRPRLCAL